MVRNIVFLLLIGGAAYGAAPFANNPYFGNKTAANCVEENKADCLQSITGITVDAQNACNTLAQTKCQSLNHQSINTY